MCVVCCVCRLNKARPFEFFGFCKDKAVILGVFFFPQPRAQRSELFSSCVFCVLCVLCVLCVMCVQCVQHAPRALDWQGSQTVLGCY